MANPLQPDQLTRTIQDLAVNQLAVLYNWHALYLKAGDQMAADALNEIIYSVEIGLANLKRLDRERLAIDTPGYP